MKGIIVLCLIYALTIPAVKAQKVDTANRNSQKDGYSYYMKRRTINNAAGWVLLGSGLIIASASYLTYVNNGFNGVWKQESLFYFGGIVAAASIPFFVAASTNKRKARLSLKSESITPGKLILKPVYPAISFAIDL